MFFIITPCDSNAQSAALYSIRRNEYNNAQHACVVSRATQQNAPNLELNILAGTMRENSRFGEMNVPSHGIQTPS